MVRIKIIAENQVTFREKTLPSLKCKLKCFHCHPRLNVHVVADLCQKTPKFFNFIKMDEWIFRQKNTNAANIGFEGLFRFCETNKRDTVGICLCNNLCGTFSDKVPQKYLQSCIGRFIHYYPDSEIASVLTVEF